MEPEVDYPEDTLREFAEKGLASARWRYNNVESIFGTEVTDAIIPGWHRTASDGRIPSREVAENIGWFKDPELTLPQKKDLELTFIFEIVKRGTAEGELVAACISKEIVSEKNSALPFIEAPMEGDDELTVEAIRKTLDEVIKAREQEIEEIIEEAVLDRMKSVKEEILQVLKQGSMQEMDPEAKKCLEVIGEKFEPSLEGIENLLAIGKTKKDGVILFITLQYLTQLVGDNQGLEFWLSERLKKRGKILSLEATIQEIQTLLSGT